MDLARLTASAVVMLLTAPLFAHAQNAAPVAAASRSQERFAPALVPGYLDLSSGQFEPLAPAGPPTTTAVNQTFTFTPTFDYKPITPDNFALIECSLYFTYYPSGTSNGAYTAAATQEYQVGHKIKTLSLLVNFAPAVADPPVSIELSCTADDTVLDQTHSWTAKYSQTLSTMPASFDPTVTF